MNCDNCNAEIDKGIFKKNVFLAPKSIELINFELNLEAKSYCCNCGDKLYKQALSSQYKRKSEISDITKKLKQKLNSLNLNLEKNIKNIPILTTHSPYNWEYTSLSLVSGQLVMGTGLISEFFSDITDIFGAKSNSFTNKFTKNEENVLNILRAKSILMGGNAVIAVDIDYGEVGTSKGMLMVCAAGTAIKLHNLNILEEEIRDKINYINILISNKRIIEKVLSENYKNFIKTYKKLNLDKIVID